MTTAGVGGGSTGVGGLGGALGGGGGAGTEVGGQMIKCACDSFQHRCLPGLDYCLTNYTCFAAMLNDDEDGGADDVTTLGCLGDRESSDMNCHVGAHRALSIKCCAGVDFCNRRLVPAYVGGATDATRRGEAALSPLSPTLQHSLYGATALVLLLIVCVLGAWRLLHFRHRQRLASLRARHQRALLQMGADELRVSSIGGSTYKALYEQSLSSSSSSGGSGSGLPLLSHHTPFSAYQPPLVPNHAVHPAPLLQNNIPRHAAYLAPNYVPNFFSPYHDVYHDHFANDNGDCSGMLWKDARNDSLVLCHDANHGHLATCRDACQVHLAPYQIPNSVGTVVEHSGRFRNNAECSGIGQSVHLMELIYRGRHSDVYRAVHRGDQVTARVYRPSHSSLWQRQLSLYTALPLRHENLLRFVGADVIDGSASQSNPSHAQLGFDDGENDGDLRFLLLMRYHVDGSLSERLRARPIGSVAELLWLLISAARGLAYLHLSNSPPASIFLSSFRSNSCCVASASEAANAKDNFIPGKSRDDEKFQTKAGKFDVGDENFHSSGISAGLDSALSSARKEAIFSTMASVQKPLSSSAWKTSSSITPLHKPAVAHRNVTSRNFFVTTEGRCCVGGLSHATIGSSTGDAGVGVLGLSAPLIVEEREVRYAAPEVLNGGGEGREIGFEAMLSSDVYAFGLVVWEATRRCLVDGVCDAYEVPYFDAVPTNPSVECMRRVVCVERRRPIASPRWAGNETLRSLHQMMRECWRENAVARPSMARVARTLERLQATLSVNERDNDASSEKT